MPVGSIPGRHLTGEGDARAPVQEPQAFPFPQGAQMAEIWHLGAFRRRNCGRRAVFRGHPGSLQRLWPHSGERCAFQGRAGAGRGGSDPSRSRLACIFHGQGVLQQHMPCRYYAEFLLAFRHLPSGDRCRQVQELQALRSELQGFVHRYRQSQDRLQPLCRLFRLHRQL